MYVNAWMYMSNVKKTPSIYNTARRSFCSVNHWTSVKRWNIQLPT